MSGGESSLNYSKKCVRKQKIRLDKQNSLPEKKVEKARQKEQEREEEEQKNHCVEIADEVTCLYLQQRHR